MTREEKYLLGCLFAVNRFIEESSSVFIVKVDGNWETVPWAEIAEWIEKQYGIEQEIGSGGHR
jgi:hypothetical protein